MVRVRYLSQKLPCNLKQLECYAFWVKCFSHEFPSNLALITHIQTKLFVKKAICLIAKWEGNS